MSLLSILWRKIGVDMNKKKFVDYSLEIILQVLKKLNLELQDAQNKKDDEKINFLITEAIPKYEKLYLAFKDEEISKRTPEELEGILKIVEDILEKNNFSKEFIDECQSKREEYKGNSGAEVVKRLFEYSIKNLKKSKDKIYEKLNPILKNEEKLEADLKEAIQYDEEMRISAEIVDLREKKRELVGKLEVLNQKISEIEDDIQKEWKYKIYGTVTQKELEQYINYKN
ncbi:MULTISPECIES: hypothetical protein [Fusobacterium]|uniref:hypothetical protein n=1 Tax=Fusobacterium TaxID=848 RepID=UPI001477885F|nr:MULTISPECIES: hypothetical protein [Fusobacterium]NME35060.1 hypothetical protein [Fusobacterium sp. FSA-380-WT-3A]